MKKLFIYLTSITAAFCLIFSCTADLEMPLLPEDFVEPSSSGNSGSSSSVLNSSSSSSGVSSSSDVSSSSADEPGIFTDPRDGQKYKYETAPNGSIWMSENLNYSKNGTVGWCYGTGTTLGTPGVNSQGCDSPYGKIYTYSIAIDGNSPQGLCPDGWHIPSRAEWTAIGTGASGTAGTRRMSSGFYVYAGNYNLNSAYMPLGWKSRGIDGFWWVRDGNNYFAFASNGEFSMDNRATSNDYFSVRCVKDEAPVLLYDSRNDKTYKTIKIGEQRWMAENLNYNTTGSVCYNNLESNCDTYGRLYDWTTAMTVCPSGWHLPSNAEWTTLKNNVGGSSTAGMYLKAVSGWNKVNSSVINLDTYGFSALPGGANYSHEGKGFEYLGEHGDWWSTAEYNSTDAYTHAMLITNNSVDSYTNNKKSGFSVRCIQN